MSWSLGEIRALSIKAARGAGMDWGMAEEAGFAVEWLEANSLDGTKAIAEYLSIASKADNFKYENCPLKLGCMISDTSDWGIVDNIEIFQPLLILPFLSVLSDSKPVLLSWENNQISVMGTKIATNTIETLITSKENPIGVKIEFGEIIAKPLAAKTRVAKDAYTYIRILTQLAHKTYAPATEASRLAGAGAGLNDND